MRRERLIFNRLVIGMTMCMGTAGGFAQSSSDCQGAILLCGDFFSEESSSFSTGAFADYTGACNGGAEFPSVWYQFTVQEPGMLQFVLSPNVWEDDYDWALFDITTGGCAGLGSFLSPEVGCNSYGSLAGSGPTGISTALGGTGVSNGPGDINGPAFNADLPVVAGSTYALVVMNWTQSPNGYTLDFGGSTASIYDGEAPGIADVEVDCALTTFTVTLTEPVLVTTLAAGDFTLVEAGGWTGGFASVVALAPVGGLSGQILLTPSTPIPQSGNYVLSFTPGSVAGGVEDACSNLGSGDFSMYLEVLTPPVGWEVLEAPRCTGEEGVLLADGGGAQPEGTAYNYSWSWTGPSGVAEGVGEGPAWVPDEDGLYTVTVTTDPPCFTATGSYAVVTEECNLRIPNVITPYNGDALNAAFRIPGLELYPGASLTIFDRWGSEVFSHPDFGASAGWSPPTSGSPGAASEGTYYFTLAIPLAPGVTLQVEDVTGVRPVTPEGGWAYLSGSIALLR
ncbi:MAG: hypothetical protein RJA19_1801 [Bacteroidota bacterium]|jgi:hypothetical protein